ncbi:MAG: hypothetical protein MJZ75_00745 [Paludibacteraceae bacterium]|nr:hypothetical protein [Paludibacteraceae bacterium]
MKKLCFIASVFVLFLGCKHKNQPTTVMDFDVTISRIESHRVWVDIFPKDEFMRYCIDWMPVEEWNAYSSEQEYKNKLAKKLSEYSPELYDMLTESGAYMHSIVVCPNTEYRFVLVGVDGNRNLTDLRVIKFTSAQEHHSTFSLEADSIRLIDGVISVSPSNITDTYFWDYELKKNVDRDWSKLHSLWFYYDIEYYYQMDFFPDILSQGKDSENIFNFYTESEIQEGDTICFLSVGYDETGETTSAYQPFWIIYHENGLTTSTMVKEATKDDCEDIFLWITMATVPRRGSGNALLPSSERNLHPSLCRRDRYIPRHIK